jgi:hypothetical protein
MEAKHTPWPWSVVMTDDRYGHASVRGACGRTVARVRGSQIDRNAPLPREPYYLTDEDIANAERIVACVNGCEGINPAAVRDMYEALRVVVRCIPSHAANSGDAERLGNLRDVLRAAIAKAERG